MCGKLQQRGMGLIGRFVPKVVDLKLRNYIKCLICINKFLNYLSVCSLVGHCESEIGRFPDFPIEVIRGTTFAICHLIAI